MVVSRSVNLLPSFSWFISSVRMSILCKRSCNVGSCSFPLARGGSLYSSRLCAYRSLNILSLPIVFGVLRDPFFVRTPHQPHAFVHLRAKDQPRTCVMFHALSILRPHNQFVACALLHAWVLPRAQDQSPMDAWFRAQA